MKPIKLPPRLLKVVQGIATGKPHKQVAVDLGISYNTLRSYRQEAYKLLGVNSEIEAVNAINQK
jgi:DNA-binding NarL/FixJ family response regulator